MDNKYQHIFFDLDRTLWHFDENSRKVLSDLFTTFNLSKFIFSKEDFIAKYEEVNDALWKLYRVDKLTKEDLRWRRFSETLLFFDLNDTDLASRMGDYYVYNSPRQTILFPNTIEVLEYLSKKYTLHIITNGFEEVQEIKLKESGIASYFNELILSERVGVKKPHPYIFKKAMNLAKAKKENSIMIGDDLYADIYGAQRVSMDHIYFNYYKQVHDKTIQHEISCLSELMTIL